MPRMNLSDDEAAYIEKLRARSAHDVGFNEGLEAAAQYCELESANPGGSHETEWPLAIRSLKRTIRL